MPTTLTLTLDDDGKLNCHGPITNKVLCFGLLELGKEAIADFHKQQANRVQPPTAEDFALIKGN